MKFFKREREQEKKTSDDLPAIVGELRNKLDIGVQHHRSLVADAELNMAFLSGNQWVTYTDSIGLQAVPNETFEYRVTDNQMKPTFGWRQYLLFKEKPVMTAFEGGDELEDAEKAYASSKLLDYWRFSAGWLNAEKKVGGWQDICGAGFMEVSFRKTLRQKLTKKKVAVEEAVEVDGKLSYVQERDVMEFAEDMAFDAYSALNTFPFPLTATAWDEITEVLTAELVTKEHLENHLGKNLENKELTETDPSELNFEAIERANRMVSPDFGLEMDVGQEKRYLLLKWRQRPSFKHPAGRYVIIAGGQVIIDEKLPYVREVLGVDPHDVDNLTMGIVPWFSEYFPGRLIPPSPMSELREHQVNLNGLKTDEKANRKKMGRQKVVVERGMLNRDQYTGEHGEIIEYNPGSNNMPQLIQGQPLAGLDREIANEIATFDRLSGRTEVLRGENPAQVRSAFHLAILEENASVPAYRMISQREDHHKNVAKVALAIARTHYSFEEIVDIVGGDATGYCAQFMQMNIGRDLRLVEGSARPRNHAAQDAKVMELLERGVLADKDGRPRQDVVLRLLRLGSKNMNIDPIERHYTRAENENGQMLVFGKVIAPEPYENHDIHIEAHQAYMTREKYYNAPESNKIVFQAHLETHLEMLSNLSVPEIDSEPPQLTAGMPAEQGGM